MNHKMWSLNPDENVRRVTRKSGSPPQMSDLSRESAIAFHGFAPQITPDYRLVEAWASVRVATSASWRSNAANLQGTPSGVFPKPQQDRGRQTSHSTQTSQSFSGRGARFGD